MTKRRWPVIGAGLLSVGLTAGLLSGCGATFTRPTVGAGKAGCSAGAVSVAPDPTPLHVTAPKDPQAAAAVPAKYRSGISVALDPSYAPNEFTANGSSAPIGMDVDLARAIGQTMGVPVTFKASSFDGIIAGIQAGRFTLGMSSFTDNAVREKTVDFVTYFKAGTSIMVPHCDPKGIHGDLDLCGLRVGAENGTTQIDQLSSAKSAGSFAKKCIAAGKKPPLAKGYPQQTDASSALQAGRIDAVVADSPVIDFALKKNSGAFQKAGQDQGVAPYGIAVPKDAGSLKTALRLALNKLIAGGDYHKILANWGVADGAIPTSKINQAAAGKK